MKYSLLTLILCMSLGTYAQTVSKFAGKPRTSGTTTNGSSDNNVRFDKPWGMTYDGNGNLWVVNHGSHAVFMRQKSDNEWYVRAGSQGKAGYSNSTGINARFDSPKGIAVGSKIYIADAGNNCIRTIDLFVNLGSPQSVGLLAGSSNGTSGHNDATGSAARFDNPSDVAVDTKGNIFVADTDNHCIRKVTTAGVVTTYAGQAGSSGSDNGDKDSRAKFNRPTGLFIDGNDNVYVADLGNYSLRKIDASSDNVSTIFSYSQGTPYDLILDNFSTTIASQGCQVTVFNPQSTTDTAFAGNHPRNCGFKNASDTNAKFNQARGIVQSDVLEYLIADMDNHVIRKMVIDPCDAVKANITVLGDTVICLGDTVELVGDANYSNEWLWPSGTSMDRSIDASKAGEYKLVVSTNIAGNSCSDTASVNIKVNPTPQTQIIIKGSKDFCPGDSVEFESSMDFDSYLWFNGDTSKSIVVKTATTVELTVTDQNGCEGDATPITTTVFAAENPEITSSRGTEFCEGENVTLTASSGFESYEWSSGDSGASLTVDVGGEFVVRATDDNGCVTTDTITLEAKPIPTKPEIMADGDSLYTDLIAPAYQWYLGPAEIPDANNAYIIAEFEGLYSVEVTAENGCSNISDQYSHEFISSKSYTKSQWSAYPNPAFGEIFVQGLEENAFYRIVDLSGKEHLEGRYTDGITVGGLQSGLYLLEVRSEEESQIFKISIK